ncbi:MAG: hypothetical protein JW760_02495 [Spirochaetales bacterium]|nr:hypothetical protein [Spirochaetales bacterium]
MKTAVSITDDLFFEAEEAARQLGLTRSGLYALALLEFIKTHKPDEITAKLNHVYGTGLKEPDVDLAAAGYDLFSQEEW